MDIEWNEFLSRNRLDHLEDDLKNHLGLRSQTDLSFLQAQDLDVLPSLKIVDKRKLISLIKGSKANKVNLWEDGEELKKGRVGETFANAAAKGFKIWSKESIHQVSGMEKAYRQFFNRKAEELCTDHQTRKWSLTELRGALEVAWVIQKVELLKVQVQLVNEFHSEVVSPKQRQSTIPRNLTRMEEFRSRLLFLDNKLKDTGKDKELEVEMKATLTNLKKAQQALKAAIDTKAKLQKISKEHLTAALSDFDPLAHHSKDDEEVFATCVQQIRCSGEESEVSADLQLSPVYSPGSGTFQDMEESLNEPIPEQWQDISHEHRTGSDSMESDMEEVANNALHADSSNININNSPYVNDAEVSVRDDELLKDILQELHTPPPKRFKKF